MVMKVKVIINDHLIRTVKISGKNIQEVFNGISKNLETSSESKFHFSSVIYEDEKIMSLNVQSDDPKEAEMMVCNIIKNSKLLLAMKRKTEKLVSLQKFDFQTNTRYTRWDSELGRYVCNSTEHNKCKKCMDGAPYEFCCELECNEHEFCKNCTFMEDRIGMRKIVQFGKLKPIALLPNNEQMFLWTIPNDLTQTEREYVMATAKSINEYGKVIIIPEKLGNLGSVTRKVLIDSLKSVIEKLEREEES